MRLRAIRCSDAINRVPTIKELTARRLIAFSACEGRKTLIFRRIPHAKGMSHKLVSLPATLKRNSIESRPYRWGSGMLFGREWLHPCPGRGGAQSDILNQYEM